MAVAETFIDTVAEVNTETLVDGQEDTLAEVEA